MLKWRTWLAATKGIPQFPVQDVTAWKKFVLSSTYGIFACARTPFKIGLGVPETRALIVAAMKETMAVAAVYGVQLDQGLPDEYVSSLSTLPVSATCSTMRDVLAGKPSEMDGLVGAVLRLADAASEPVPVPTHRRRLSLRCESRELNIALRAHRCWQAMERELPLQPHCLGLF